MMLKSQETIRYTFDTDLLTVHRMRDSHLHLTNYIHKDTKEWRTVNNKI